MTTPLLTRIGLDAHSLLASAPRRSTGPVTAPSAPLPPGSLAGVFCNDAVEVKLASIPASGVPFAQRTYPSFSAAAEEAGISRVVGGIHFNLSGNQAGLAAGRAVADEVLANKLLLKHGPTHFGQCPL